MDDAAATVHDDDVVVDDDAFTVNVELSAALTLPYLPRYGDAFRVDILGGDGSLQLVQLPGLLQLLHQTFHGFLTPLLLLAVLLSFLPAQKSLDNGGSERQN